MTPRLGVNLDHIATLRQLRGTPYPDLLVAAEMTQDAGAEQITVHLREDRRHIQDEDVRRLRKSIRVPLNLEMAATDQMAKFALRVHPDWICLVPEKRQEVTTEGGLALDKNRARIASVIKKMNKAKIKVSCFIEPALAAVKLSRELGADAVEFHTGRYCLASQQGKAALLKKELLRIRKAAELSKKIGIHPHAGHGFDYENVRAVVELMTDGREPLIEEYNIGHAVVCRAALVGLERAVREMVSAIKSP